VIEPFYESYIPMATIAGATCQYVTLRPSPEGKDSSQGFSTAADWKWDEQELENAFNSKTRAIIVNSPNNPLGKMNSRAELEKIAELCIKHNVLCISDEVYQHITYDKEHIRIGLNYTHINL
jgi:kynurenine--oxoglutarate transaminase/cysteine-S-conjugate beta-lyase/glutamine--phenylpyruvate transaminase